MALHNATERPSTSPGNVRRKLAWRQAAVIDIIAETASARTLVFDLDGWDGHVAGQHVDVRLTAEDGYQATRSYSLSSGPNEAPQITIEPVSDGEVSPYLAEELEPGDEVELRGPVGGYFVWVPSDGDQLLVGGGSGIAPLRAMWRARAGTARSTVLYSARTEDRAIFACELATDPTLDARIHLTRETRAGYRSGHIGAADLETALETASPGVIYLCGPTAFVEAVSNHLVRLDVDPRTIRAERFG